MNAKTLALLIRAMCPEHRTGCPTEEMRTELATIVVEEARPVSMDPAIVVAVMGIESRFHPGATGLKGEVGLMQLLPRGGAATLCTDLPDLRDPRSNVRCGLRLLARARRVCGTGAPKAHWLGIYSGVRKCGPSAYGACVVAYLATKKRCPPKVPVGRLTS